MPKRSMTIQLVRVAMIAGVLDVTAIARAGATIVLNGGFELPVLAPGGAQVFSRGYLPAERQGWWVFGPLGPDVYVLQDIYSEPFNNVSRFNASEGLNALDITGPNNTGPTTMVGQNIGVLVAGVAYDLAFDVGRVTPASGPGGVYALPATISAQVDLGPVVEYTNSDITLDGVNWKRFHYTFTAVFDSATVVFRNATPLACNYAGLDNVVVTRVDGLAVPPATTGGELSFAAPSPNPAGDELTIRFTLPRAGHVRAVLCDAMGRVVRGLLDTDRSAGTHTESLPLRSAGGSRPAPGLYFVCLEAGGRMLTHRLAIIR